MKKERKPKYVQLAAQLRDFIVQEDLKVGDRLPSYTEIYRQFGAASATAQRVYALLEEEGVVERRSGSGVYVAEPEQTTRQKTNTIGLLVHSHYWGSGDTAPYQPSQAILAGIHHACKEAHQEVLLLDNDNVHAGKTDGIIIYSDKLEAYSLGISLDVPQVLLGQQADDIMGVTIDDYAAGKMATNHLIENGHQRIACIMEGVFDETLQRIAGYRAVMLKSSIDANPRWLRKTSKINITPTFAYLEWGRQQMREWLESDWHDLGCTAIIVQNDQAAIGAMQVLQEEGIKVPEDVSVIGFDGTRACDLAQPRLTSIQVPYYEMGFEAVKVLLAQVEHPAQQTTSATIMLPVHLRDGNSIKNLV